jgi:chromosome segregation ATPase
VAGAVAYLKVGGLPGVLYAAGICVAAFFGAIAILAGGTERSAKHEHEHEPAAAPRPRRRGRKSRIIAELEVDLAARDAELTEHRQALANLATQLSRTTQAAQRHAQQLDQRIGELEAERDSLHATAAKERERFEQTLDDLGGGIGRHGDELAELERELEALIAR